MVFFLRSVVVTLLRRPGFATAVVATLALGSGVACAIFAVVDAVLLQPLPYPEPERLYMVWESHLPRKLPRFPVAPANFLDWREQNESFDNIAVWRRQAMGWLRPGERPVGLETAVVSAGFFDVLGTIPLLGRGFSAGDDEPGTARTVVLAETVWRQRFAADQDIVGRELLLDGEAHSVIGVMPETLALPAPEVEIWVTMTFDAVESNRRMEHYLTAVGRLHEGVSAEQAHSDMNRLAAGLAELYPETNKNWTVTLVPLEEHVVGDIAPVLWMLLAAVAVLLLVPCASAASLLLNRHLAREQEFALRSAYGARRRDLLARIWIENLLLAFLASVLGLALAWGLFHVLARIQPGLIPRLDAFPLDSRLVLFTLAVALATAFVSGLGPLFILGRANLFPALREGGGKATASRGRGRLRAVFATAQLVIAVLLLAAAGLTLRGLGSLLRIDPGFEIGDRLAMALTLSGKKYDKPARALFFDRVIERLEELPGVESAGSITVVPLSGDQLWLSVRKRGEEAVERGQLPRVGYSAVSADFFATAGMRILRGRGFTEDDRETGRAVAVINERLAEIHWPGEDPLGQSVTIHDLSEMNPRQVVGVVNDARHRGLAAEVRPEIYVPYRQRPWHFMTLMIHTRDAAARYGEALREAVWQVDPDQVVQEPRLLARWLDDSVAQTRFYALVLSFFAATASVLALVGLYGTLAYSVALRRREISVRMALGARGSGVAAQIVAGGLRMALLGLVIGAALLWSFRSLLQAFLHDVTPLDPLTWAGVAGLTLVFAFVASWLPARRAAHLDPVRGLKEE